MKNMQWESPKRLFQGRSEFNFSLRYCEMFPRKNVFPGFILNLIVY